MYLTQGLHRAIQRHPSKLAVKHVAEDGNQALTFAELAHDASCYAAALMAQGVSKGDRVALLSPNNANLIIQLWACWWLGAVACPLNIRWNAAEIGHAVIDAGAKVLVVDLSLQQVTASIQKEVSVVNSPALAQQAKKLNPVPDTRTSGDALAALLYTGGTTGKSKGVMLTHAQFWSASITRAAELNNPPDGVSLLVAPLFHVAGLGRLVGQSLVGGTCITMPSFRPDLVASAIEEHGITDTIMVPSMLQSLLALPNLDLSRLQSLNRIAFGAAPMPPDLLDKALAAWPKAEFFQAYGLTETAGAVCINLPNNHRGAGRANGLWRSVGRPGFGAEIRIVDPLGVEVPRGTVGEIELKGAMVTHGYWNLPEITASAFRDGWFRTGDGGRMDADGYLFIADRLKDMIISGGENIYSAEVEAALRTHPAVVDVAVIGVPHERWGESVHAVVVARQQTSTLQDELMACCKAELSGYKCPRSMSFVEALPMSAAGKVLKNQLREAMRIST
ncbi:MAG: hypothetical protein RLY82_138 [Pseudomonadota bacterium]|jgi:long-chain acyl-CoA synthetase